MRRRIDVDVRNRCISAGRHYSFYAITLAARRFPDGGADFIMRRCNVLLAMIWLFIQASAFAAGSTMEEPTSTMVASYWGYVALPPAMIVALVVYGWLLPRNR